MTITDGSKPVSLMLEESNAPVLTVRAGAANRGTIRIEANVDDAEIWVNGKKNARKVKAGLWMGQYDPGEYKVRVTRPGYEDTAERSMSVAAGKNVSMRFDLSPVVTTAFIKVQGGTPEAEVVIDGRTVGKLDANGTIAETAISPDVDHTIRLQRENYEPKEIRRRAGVKDMISIGGADAVLKPFGTLVLEVQPGDAQVTIQRRGEPARRVTERTLRVREGTYTVTASVGRECARLKRTT